MSSLITNAVLTLALTLTCRQVYRLHIVNIQSTAFGLIVYHSKVPMGEHRNLIEIVEKEGEKANLDLMGIIFRNDCVSNTWGDKYELVQRTEDGKLSVQPVGSTFGWP